MPQIYEVVKLRRASPTTTSLILTCPCRLIEDLKYEVGDRFLVKTSGKTIVYEKVEGREK